MIDAFMAALGERASVSSIRNGEKKALVEAVFDINGRPEIRDFIVDKELDCDSDELILRREINSAGNSRSFINDSPAPNSTLKDLGDMLVDFHGQHDHQLLLKSSSHLSILDTICDFKNLKINYKREYDKTKKIAKELSDLIAEAKNSAITLDHYQYELDEINKIDPRLDELDEVEAKLNKIENSEKIFDLSSAVYYNLFDADRSARDLILEAKRNLETLTSYDEEFAEYLKECESALISIEEAAKFASSYSEKSKYDSDEIEKLRSRQFALNGLRKKYGSFPEIFERKAFLENSISKLVNFDEKIEVLTNELNESRKKIGEIANEISIIRNERSGVFADSIIDSLNYLGMQNSKFKVEISNYVIENKEQVFAEFEGKKYKAFPDGIDFAEFYISANLGENLKPLKDTASGGEISRIMLSLKSVVAEYKAMPMLVFDEIDTGISGKIGQKTGLVMKNLAKAHQILAITHLPQIAALGDTVFWVSKSQDSEKTSTHIRALTDSEIERSIAQMLSGENISQAAIESAKELINYRE
jgi:DNA repair protein RecN (Recombination protein N)